QATLLSEHEADAPIDGNVEGPRLRGQVEGKEVGPKLALRDRVEGDRLLDVDCALGSTVVPFGMQAVAGIRVGDAIRLMQKEEGRSAAAAPALRIVHELGGPPAVAARESTSASPPVAVVDRSAGRRRLLGLHQPEAAARGLRLSE